MVTMSEAVVSARAILPEDHVRCRIRAVLRVRVRVEEVFVFDSKSEIRYRTVESLSEGCSSDSHP